MTRQSDKAVASNTKSLGPELQARVDIAEKNKADLFVSVYANSNPNTSIAGAMTFYPQNKSPKLAQAVQTSLVTQTQAVDKGVSPATFYVLRNTNMPSILVETGFLTNSREAAQLAAAPYQEKVAEGIFSGIVRYLQQG